MIGHLSPAAHFSFIQDIYILYCISILYILAVHTNQKRFQCSQETQREESSLERMTRGTWLTS